MALTLAEAQKLSNDILALGVVEDIVSEDSIFDRLGFIEVLGNGLTYNRETTLPTVNFYDVGDTWVESTGSVTSTTATLKILGGDVDIDTFLRKTRSNLQDLVAEHLQLKAKAMKNKFMDGFFYGATSGDAKSFDGLHALITSTTKNTVHAGSSTGTALSMNKLREAIDKSMGFAGSQKVIVSSKEIRRRVEIYLDSIGSAYPASPDTFGRYVKWYRELPWVVSDYILDTETAASGAYSAKTGGGNTSIFLLVFDPKGIQGIQAGPLTVEHIGQLETKDAERWRIKWYVSLMMQSLLSCTKVDGIDADGTVTA